MQDRTEKDSAGSDLSGETTDQGTDQTGGDVFKPAENASLEFFHHFQPEEERKKRRLGFYPPEKTPLEKLEQLLERAENTFGSARINFMEQLVIFLNNNRNLINKVPKNGKYNALELALEIGPAHVIDALVEMRATVRSERKVVPIQGYRM